MPVRTGSPVIVHHMAALNGHGFWPNTLEAIEACLSARAQIIEIDAKALQADDYLLVHDEVLETETTGSGPVEECSVLHARDLYARSQTGRSGYHVALLSDVVRLFLSDGGTSRLQIDYKNLFPFPDEEPLRRLIKIIEPLGKRVIVSSIADWQLRKLRALAPHLPLGLDVQFYLDWRLPDEAVDPRAFPRHPGAYGYWDDHPLALGRFWSTEEYLRDRCGMLLGLVPEVSVLYVRHQLLAQSLVDGFNWAAMLHRSNVQLDAWTLDLGDPIAEANLPPLLAAGVDMITTNTPMAMAARLDNSAPNA
ncbi:MAG TPA: glycerophosphodiester phosphodiesterase family protein [Anaerolineae bacterium]